METKTLNKNTVATIFNVVDEFMERNELDICERIDKDNENVSDNLFSLKFLGNSPFLVGNNYWASLVVEFKYNDNTGVIETVNMSTGFQDDHGVAEDSTLIRSYRLDMEIDNFKIVNKASVEKLQNFYDDFSLKAKVFHKEIILPDLPK